MRYARLHGCNNDYVYVEETELAGMDPVEVARAVSPRDGRKGAIGSDGLIILARSTSANVRMIVHNADGSRAAMCGNGVRALAKWVLDSDPLAGELLAEAQDLPSLQTKLDIESAPIAAVIARVESAPSGAVKFRRLNVETDSGIKPIHAVMINDAMWLAAVDMGLANTHLRDTGAAKPIVSTEHPVVSVSDREYPLKIISTGNLHAVVEVADVASIDIATVGPVIECDPMFPDRCNVHFVERRDKRTLIMRPWERGSGATQACGTGAVASAYALGDPSEPIEVRQPGGSVWVVLQQVDAESARAWLIGPAELCETGDWQPQ